MPDLAGESPVDAVVMTHGARPDQRIKYPAATQVHHRRPASAHGRMPHSPMPTETREEALAGPKRWPRFRGEKERGADGHGDGEGGAQEKRRRKRSGDVHCKCAPAAHRAKARADPKIYFHSSRPAIVRITAPALRAETDGRSEASPQ